MGETMKKDLIISLCFSLGIGFLSSILTMNSMDIYKYLNKPRFSLPSIIFPIVWTVIYILLGISAYIIYKSKKNNKKALIIYLLQLLFNFIWPISFFLLNYRLLALFIIIILLFLVIFMILEFYKVNYISAYLQIPYLFWVLFATYLNYGFYILNK